MTLQEHFETRDLSGKTVSWVGDGNNVLHCLMLGSVLLGVNVQVATPVGMETNAAILKEVREEVVVYIVCV